MMELRPVPIIILAKALSRNILNVIAVMLYLLINKIRVLPEAHQNGTFMNLLTGIVAWLSILLHHSMSLNFRFRGNRRLLLFRSLFGLLFLC